MGKRPLSLTVVSWIFIILGAIGLLTLLFGHGQVRSVYLDRTGENIPFIMVILSWINAIVFLISGIFMQLRMNWARYLFILWGAIAIIISFIMVQPWTLVIPSLIIYLIFAYFLLVKSASAYFAGNNQ